MIWCSGARRWIMNPSSVFSSITSPPSMPRPPPSFVIHPLISVFFTQPWLSVEFEEAKIFILCLLCLTPVSPQVPKYLSISVHLDNATSVHLSHLSRGTHPIPRAPSWPLLCLFFFCKTLHAYTQTHAQTVCLMSRLKKTAKEHQAHYRVGV